MNNKLIIMGVDLDGVIADMVTPFLSTAKHLYGIELTREDITDYWAENCTPLTAEQTATILSMPVVFQAQYPIAGASLILKNIQNLGVRIHIITDRSFDPELELTKKWLRLHGIPYNALDNVRASEKTAFAKELGIGTFVEDRLDTANALAEVCNTVYLFDAPYNQGPTAPNVTRVYGGWGFFGWLEVVNMRNRVYNNA